LLSMLNELDRLRVFVLALVACVLSVVLTV